MRISIFIGVVLSIMLCTISCAKKNHSLIFKFKFDATAARLDNFGNPTGMPAGHWGQNPSFNMMSAHYIELAADKFTALGSGAVLYRAAETTAGGSSAIDFDREINVKDGEVFFSLPLDSVKPGTYEWLRVSLAYQNYDVKYYVDSVFNASGTPYHLQDSFTATIASFIGFNTYIHQYTIKTKVLPINANQKQGYWGVESTLTLPGYSQTFTQTGQAPGTTVVNPIASSSPIPAGSCVVTGSFMPGKLTISGAETSDVVVTVNLSTHQSFEWVDKNGNHLWDALQGENVVDMGIRGLIPIKPCHVSPPFVWTCNHLTPVLQERGS